MNRTILLFSLCFLQFANGTNPPVFSECYGYHTPHFYEIFTENNHIVLQHTVKDPNRISYVSRDKTVLDSINSKGFKLLAEDDKKFLFSTKDGYFMAEKDGYEMKNYGATKIAESNSISEIIGTDLICRNGLWYYLIPQSYSKEIIEKEVKNVPNNLEVYKIGIVREGPLLKNEKAVYIFDTEKLYFKQIPNLIGKNTHFFHIKSHIDEGFIYDDDTFYFIAYDDLIDYTEQFTSQEVFTTLRNVEIIKHQYEYSIHTNDGYIWLYLKFEIENENGIRKKITPIKASYLGKNKQYINYNNKIYNDFSDLLRNYDPIDMSIIKNPSALETQDYVLYNDGKNSYLFDYKEGKFKLFNRLPANLTYYSSIDTYHHMNVEFYANNENIYFFEHPNKISKTIKHTSAIKNLSLAYAYDDKLLIESNEIVNIADRESMEFIGSTVNVISPCDGGDGQYPVVIDVYYFFRDKTNVFAYNSSSSKMRIIENKNPNSVKINDYDYLMQLMKAI